MTDKFLPIIWGETQAINPPATPGTMDRLYAVIAAMAMDGVQRGLDGRFRQAAAPAALSPRANDYGQASKVLNDVQTRQYAGDKLPARAALWEITSAGLPRQDSSGPVPPSWLSDPDMVPGAVYTTGSGSKLKQYRLYQSPKQPDPGQMAYVSGITGTGLVSSAKKPVQNLAWVVGFSGLMVFLAGCVWSISTGQSNFRNAETAIRAHVVTNLASQKFPSAWTGCSSTGKVSGSEFSFNTKTTKLLCDTDPDTLPSDLPGLLLTTGGIGLIAIGLGLGTKQRITGVWINNYNRVSLSRAQVSLWTIVVLGSCTSFALVNVGAQPSGTLLSVFPNIPDYLWAAMGITIVSPMVSAMILGQKSAAADQAANAGASNSSKSGVTFFGVGGTGLDTNESPGEASIADIFMGEENANADIVDLSRLQNVIITLMLVIIFFWSVITQANAIDLYYPGADFTLFRPLQSLPAVDSVFTTFLLVSHGTYLTAKAYDNKSSSTTDQNGGTPVS